MNDWSDAERRVERAQELFERRQWKEALSELRAATDINPYNGAWFFNIGLVLDEMGRLDEAVQAYRQAVSIDPNDIAALNHLGQDLYRTSRLKESLRTFERIEVIDPSYEPSYCPRILAYAELGDHDKAEEMFYSGRLYREHCPHCYDHMGWSLFARGLWDKAIFCWLRALDMPDASPDLHPRIAQAFWRKGQLEQARRHFLSDLRRNPGRTSTLISLGDLLEHMGRFDEAGEKFRRAIELAPDDPAVLYHHGRWLLRNGNNAQAALAFRKVLTQDPTFGGAHHCLGRLCLQRRDINAARAHFHAESMLRPQDPRLLLELAGSLMDIDDTRTAIACLKRLTQLQPDNIEAWQNLAVAQFMRKHYNDGIASCRRALDIDPASPTALYNLALACECQGQWNSALTWIRLARKHRPTDDSLADLEFRIRFLRLKAIAATILRRALRLNRR
jgi:tetratricopeptide (TPR) repeat protein